MNFDKKATAQEVPVQEQLYKGICPQCNHNCIIKLISSIQPTFCYKCGSKMNYLSSKSLNKDVEPHNGQ